MPPLGDVIASHDDLSCERHWCRPRSSCLDIAECSGVKSRWLDVKLLDVEASAFVEVARGWST